MRIAVVNTHRNIVGGIETYLADLLPHLCKQHELSLLTQSELCSREQISGPFECWNVTELGYEKCLERLKAWRPDVIAVHSWPDVKTEEEILSIAPAIAFLHAYEATCISGQKRNALPSPAMCTRRLGFTCLLNYFPRRCGGLNPFRMGMLYSNARKKLHLLRSQYKNCVVFSDWMEAEYRRHYLDSKIQQIPFYPLVDTDSKIPVKEKSAKVKFLFVGRMTALKGGDVFLRALHEVADKFDFPVEAVLIGDGPKREEWERLAAQTKIKVSFCGWLTREKVFEEFGSADLLVLPSLWPEPFGLVGLEAGCFGLPTIAFDVGGISSWLKSGTNGILVSAESSTVTQLGLALVRLVNQPELRRRLSEGASRTSRQFSRSLHLKHLNTVFGQHQSNAIPSVAMG